MTHIPSAIKRWIAAFFGTPAAATAIAGRPAASTIPAGTKFLAVIPATSNVWRIKFDDIPDNTANIVQFYNTVTDASVAEFTFQDVDDHEGSFANADAWAGGLSSALDGEELGFTKADVSILSVAVADISAVDITFNTGTSNIGVRIVKGAGVENDEGSVWTAPWVKVSGAGDTSVNHIWKPAGLENGSPFWTANPANGDEKLGDTSGGHFAFQNAGGDPLYDTTSNGLSTPIGATFQIGAGSGTSPAPTVSQLGSDAVTQSITRDVLLGDTIQKLSTTTVHTDVGTKQALYTVPAGKVCVVTQVIMRNPSVNVAYNDFGSVLNFGEGSNWYPGDLFIALNPATSVFQLFQVDAALSSAPLGAADEVFGITMGQTGTTATVDIDVFGYLIDA